MAAQTYDDDDPAAADEIRDGLQRLRDLEVEARIAVAAAYIEQGEAVYVASSESAVTEALRRLRDDLQRASAMAEPSADGEPGDGGMSGGSAAGGSAFAGTGGDGSGADATAA